MTTKEQRMEKYSSFDLYDEEALIDGIAVCFGEALTEEETIDNRIYALKIYLAMQYYLHLQRSRVATDSLERDNQLQLVNRFSKVFLDEDGLLKGLFHYCDDNAFRYFGKREMGSWGSWRNLADAIRNEINARNAND